jgi:hypothetical protein
MIETRIHGSRLRGTLPLSKLGISIEKVPFNCIAACYNPSFYVHSN